MDCKTARLLLDYARPRAAELDPAEAAALEEHLASCADCDQAARAEGQFDDALGHAMRQVDVPDRLRVRILNRLSEDRGENRLRRVFRGLRWSAAVAAALLLTAGASLGAWRWLAHPPAFPTQNILVNMNQGVVAPPDKEKVEANFKEQGVATVAPVDLDYSFLVTTILAEIQGRQAPLLIFERGMDEDRNPRRAFVYILADNQFDLKALPGDLHSEQNYYKCAVETPPGGEPYRYVIYYTGDDREWLRSPATDPVPDAAAGN